MKALAWALLIAAGARAETYSFWIQACTPELPKQSGCEAADSELARWALEAWEKAASGQLNFREASQENKARIRIYWAPGNMRLYGEARPILVDGQMGAAVYVRPDLAALGPDIGAAGQKDRLFRDTVVYLTCLHESGHALGLPHSAAFEDIMYSFQFGGDILEYFSRFRRRLVRREDIRNNSGISAADRARLQQRAALFDAQ